MEKINLLNFADIKSFDCKLSSLIIFCGVNQKTKTNLAKLIALFRNWEFEGKLKEYQSLMERFSIDNVINSSTKIKYEYIQKEDVLIQNDNYSYNLKNGLAVIQSVLPLKIVLEYYKKVSRRNQKTQIKGLKTFTFLIEEPELNLHPDNYAYIIDEILNNCDLSINDLIITTNQNEISSLFKERYLKTKTFSFSNGEIKEIEA